MKKTLWVLLLTVCIVFTGLAFTVQADDALELTVKAGGGDYTSIESALAAVETMAANGELNAKGVKLVLSGTHTASATESILFGQKTIFLPSGRKVPITITGGTLNLPTGSVVCTNDYTFTQITIPLDDVQTKIYAGTGNVVMGNITMDLNETVERKSRFFGDNFTAKAFEGWTEDNLEFYTEDGLFTSSMTLAAGFSYTSHVNSAIAASAASTDFSATVGTKTLSADDICAKLIIDGATVNNPMAKAGKNAVGNSVLHIKSGSLNHIFAGGFETQTTLTGDLTVIADGTNAKLNDFPRLLSKVTLNGDLNVTLKNLDQMSNTTENGKMIQIGFSGVSVNGDINVTMENVKADRYYGALGCTQVNGDISVTAKNCEFSRWFYSGFGTAAIVGNVTNTLENVNFPFYRGLDECPSLTGNLTTNWKGVTIPDQKSAIHVYMGSMNSSAVVNGNFINTMEEVTMGDNVNLYMGPYGGTLNGDITSTIKSGTYSEYFYGATNTGTVTGTITNNIQGGTFLYEVYLAGFYTNVQGQLINNISGGNFEKIYLYCGSRSGKITNTELDYAVKNYFSGGFFKGVWGGSGGGSVTHNGNIYNEITGGHFSTYSTDNSKMNSFAGGPRNTKHVGNVKTLIRGGIFEGWVAGGAIPNDVEYGKTNEGNTELTIAGGDFRHIITANCRWGTFTGETHLNIDTSKGLEPLKVATNLECNDVIASSDTYELVIPTNITAKNVITRGSKALTLNGKVNAETFTVESTSAEPFIYNTANIGTLTMNGKALNIGAKTKITASAVVGPVALHQTELWSANTYFASPADTVINITEADDAFGRIQLKDGVVKGLSSSLAGVGFVFADNISLRFAFDKEWVESVKNDFSFTAKAGTQTIVNAAKFSDLVLKDGYYTIVSSAINTTNYNKAITYSGTYIPERSFLMTELAATGIKVYDKAGQYPELANLLKAFSNYAVATDNYQNDKSAELPYENLATPTDFHLIIDGNEEKDWAGVNHTGSSGNGYMTINSTPLELTGKQFILDDGMRVRYYLKGSQVRDDEKNSSKVHSLYFWSGCENITSTITKTWQSDGYTWEGWLPEKVGHYEITVDIPVYPSHTGGGYVRFFVTEQATLNNSTKFVIDHIDRIDALAEEMATVYTEKVKKELGSTLQYYLQAAAEYYPTQPNMENFEYPETFSAGYAIGDVSPYGFRMQMYSYAKGQFVIDPMYITCLAMWDGSELALYYSSDTRQCDDTFTKEYKAILSEKFGVDPNKIFFNATHNHSSPDLGQRSKENVRRWYDEILEPTLYSVTKAAILDLAPAEVYAGKATSDPGTNYVRRYFREDGSFTGIHVYETAEQSASPVVRYESEADKELRTLRFDRGDKKDIVLANWQGHAAHGANQYKTQFTGDFVYWLRKGVQENSDVNFIYCNGASGNLNFTPKTQADVNAKYFTGNFFEGVGKSLVGTVQKAVAAEEKINTGDFQVTHIEYIAPTKKDPDDIMAKAIEINNACKAYVAENGNWISVTQQRTYIFDNFNKKDATGPYVQSTYHLSSLMSRNGYWTSSTPTTEHVIDVFAFACGDFAMGFVPYEQFDTNAKQTRDGVADLYKITITGAYTNGTKSYVPSNLSSIDNTVAMEQHYGGYEVYTCRYEDGTGDGVAAAIKNALREFKSAQ